jgi:HEAT repeat protein
MRFRRCALFSALLGYLALSGSGMAADVPMPSAEDEKVLREAGIGNDGASLLAFLASRTLTPAVRTRAAALIRQLGDDEFDRRQAASAALLELGPVVLPVLEPALRDEDLEIRTRATRLVESLRRRDDLAVAGAAVRALALRAPPGSARALLAYLANSGEYEIDNIRLALQRVAVRDGKVDAALLAALRDTDPLHRRVAIDVVASAGRDYFPLVRALLTDSDASVRLRAALALGSARERDAVPVLIALLSELPADQVYQTEDALFRLAGESPPELPSDSSPAGRAKRRAVWADWWTKNAERVDLARLSGTAPLGYTLAVIFPGGNVRVSEFGPGNRVLWKIEDLDNAVDAHIVAGNRVLLAEYGAQRVTERTFDNKIVWEKKLDEPPILCQRLPNGNTFIVTQQGYQEVDRNGKQISRVTGLHLRAAYRYADGRIGRVDTSGQYVRLSRSGKSEIQFPALVQIANTLGGVDFLPDGGLLLGRSDRVVQLDATGKEVWSVKVTRPYGATRLPNGNTIVASTSTRELLEFDRTGRVVRSIKTDGDPWVARRR